jgi:hypothetical protein
MDVGRPLNSQLPFRAIFPGVELFWGDNSESAPRCLRPRCASGTSERNSDDVCLVNSIAIITVRFSVTFCYGAKIHKTIHEKGAVWKV